MEQPDVPMPVRLLTDTDEQPNCDKPKNADCMDFILLQE
jgi:hypothetical protein